MPREPKPIPKKTVVKERKSISDDDEDDSPPPLIPMEPIQQKVEVVEEEPDALDSPTKITLKSILDPTLLTNQPIKPNPPFTKNNEKGGYFSKNLRPTRISSAGSKLPSSSIPSTSSSSNRQTSAFLSVVGKHLHSWNPNDEASPSKKYRSSLNEKATSSSTSSDIQSFLQSQKPIRVDVAVGNGTSSPSSNEHEESPTSNDTWNCSAKLLDDTKSVKESVVGSMKKKEFPGDMIVTATNHNLLLGCMIINGLTTIQKRGNKNEYSELCGDLYQILQKYNVS